MSRVLTFSRVFPSYHPRAGEPTYFIEKIYNFLFGHFGIVISFTKLCELNPDVSKETLFAFHTSIERGNTDIKNHTIRAGHRFKKGDSFSPRVWSGKPYTTKQIIISPDIKIPKTFDFEVDGCGIMSMALPGEQLKYLDEDVDKTIAHNDGLEYNDFIDWIVLPHYIKTKDSGPMQIICWNENINY